MQIIFFQKTIFGVRHSKRVGISYKTNIYNYNLWISHYAAQRNIKVITAMKVSKKRSYRNHRCYIRKIGIISIRKSFCQKNSLNMPLATVSLFIRIIHIFCWEQATKFLTKIFTWTFYKICHTRLEYLL